MWCEWYGIWFWPNIYLNIFFKGVGGKRLHVMWMMLYLILPQYLNIFFKGVGGKRLHVMRMIWYLILTQYLNIFFKVSGGKDIWCWFNNCKKLLNIWKLWKPNFWEARSIAHGGMGRWIDPSWWTLELLLLWPLTYTECIHFKISYS